MFARTMKLNEYPSRNSSQLLRGVYFTDILSHREHTRNEEVSPAIQRSLKPSQLSALQSMRQSPEKPSPIRMNDTHRSTLQLGDHRSLTPAKAVVDQQQVLRNEFRQHLERAKSQITLKRVEASHFTPVKREFYKGDKSPTYRELDAGKCWEIAQDTYNSYRNTQDMHKRGQGAKISLQASEAPQVSREVVDWKEKAPAKAAGPTMTERRFRCHRRNLDGELAQVIRAEENVQQDKMLN